jgi:hypothetical protein
MIMAIMTATIRAAVRLVIKMNTARKIPAVVAKKRESELAISLAKGEQKGLPNLQ